MQSTVITIVVRLKIKAGKMDTALAVVSENVAASHKEPGMLKMALHRDPADPQALWFVEVYRDEAAIEAHMATDHLKKVVAALPDLLESGVVSARGREIIYSDHPKGVLGAPSPLATSPPLVVVATFPVAEGAFDQASALLKTDALPTYEEEGVVKFAAHRHMSEPDRFLVVEVYRDTAALEFHHQTPHLAKIAAELPALLAGEMSVTRLEPVPVGDPAKGLL